MTRDTASRACRGLILASLFAAAGIAEAATYTFNTDPFAGTTVLETPGRQVVGGELFIANFDPTVDIIRFDPSVFKTAPAVNFFNGLASDLPAGGLNVIVLQDIDADGNPANGILNNAVLSADLIANQLTRPGAGFFVYFNSVLNLNRLVYSTDLSSSASDLKIIARFTGSTGADAIAALPQFSAATFEAKVPEPRTWAMMILGFGLVGAAVRRRAGAVAA